LFPVSLETFNGPKRKKKDNANTKFGGTNKEYNGIFRNGLFSLHLSLVARLLNESEAGVHLPLTETFLPLLFLY